MKNFISYVKAREELEKQGFDAPGDFDILAKMKQIYFNDPEYTKRNEKERKDMKLENSALYLGDEV